MRKIEIYERATGQVVETQDCGSDSDLSAFRKHWAKQCNEKEFGFRIVGGSGRPFQRRIVKKEADGHHATDDRVEFLPLTDTVCAEIARFNEDMTQGEVHSALLAGRTIYTNFRRYQLEA